MKFLEFGWLAKSFLSLLFIIPAWLSIGFLKKNYGISAEITAVGYFAGTAIGAASILSFTGELTFSSAHKLWLPLAVGVTLGTLTNLLIFSAIPVAPNPGLPIAIQSSSIAFVFLLSAFLATLMPSFFEEVKLDSVSFLGILLVICGIVIIASRH